METRDLKDSSLLYFPIQKLAYKDKDLSWREACVDGVISIAYNFGRSRRSPARYKRRNYNLFNNKIDRSDFDYVLNPFNLSKEQLKEFNYPASLQPYDIISRYFHLLLGEEGKRVFNPVVRAINQDSLSEKQKMKKDQVLQVLNAILTQGLNPEQQDPNNPPPPPEQLLKYQNYTPQMMRESIADKLLNFYMKKESLPIKFNDCFKDALIAGEEHISIERLGTGVQARRVNPLEFFFVLNNNSDIVDDAEKLYERNYLTVSEVIDQFYEYLTEDQIRELESIQSGAIPTNIYGPPILNIGEVDSIYTFEDDYGQRGIPVHRVRWKSKKKMGIHHFDDAQGTPQEEVVEETFKLNKQDPTAWIEWFWINEYWEGVRIGVDMYLHPIIRPRRQQFRSMDNLSECKSGYVGTVYSCTNTQSVSLMDRLVPWVYLYLIIWYRTELLISKNIGNIGLIDTSLIPDGWDPEKWMYYAQAMGFGFINTYNESNRASGMPGGVNNSSQNKVLPLEHSQFIIQHLSLLQHIDERIQATAGITPQRLGAITSQELVGNTERSVTQSSHITEPYFLLHENFKLRVCDAVIEVAKECLEGKSMNFQYITDDLAEVLFEVDGNEFNNSDYGVFVSNTSRDQSTLETAKQLLQAALQNDKLQLSDAISVLNSTSVADIKAVLKNSEQEAAQRQAQEGERQSQMQQQQIEAQQQQLQFTQEFEKEKLDRDDYNKEQDRQVKIQVAEIGALSFSKDTDADNDGVPDVIETSKLALEDRKHQAQVHLEQQKLGLEKQKIDAENARTKQDGELKKKELETKERIEKYKAAHRPKPAAKKK